MTNEDEIKFILESQSRMSRHLEELAQRQDKFQEQLGRTEEEFRKRTEGIERATLALLSIVGESEQRFNESLRALAEQGRRTDERISIVVNMVEKWIAEDQKRRNGDR
jgi:hypothetical protein